MWFKAMVVLSLYYVIENVQAQIGTTCKTPNGEAATCKSIYDCRILLNVVQTRSEEQVRFLRESQCGYDRNPLVCCGSKDNYASLRSSQRNTTRNTASRSGEIPKNNVIPNRSTCGFQFSDRIFNGESTTPDEFPWMALMEYSNSSGHRRYSCGGTLISPRYILTAAHCVTGEIIRKVGNLVNVRLGEWNTSTETDCIDQGSGIRFCNDPPKDLGIEEFIAHPDYDNRLNDRYNDIALVRLNKEVNYSTFIRPICLPLPSESSRVGEKLTVAGWGKTEKASRSPVKLKLEVPIAERSQCTANFRSAGIDLEDSQICAGGQAGKDSCTGDSGGPLMKVTQNDSSQWYIEGVVSFGAKCGSEGWPGIYTKVSRYLDWIYGNVKP